MKPNIILISTMGTMGLKVGLPVVLLDRSKLAASVTPEAEETEAYLLVAKLPGDGSAVGKRAALEWSGLMEAWVPRSEAEEDMAWEPIPRAGAPAPSARRSGALKWVRTASKFNM